MRKPNEERRGRWRKLIEAQASSGETVVGFCARRGLRPKQFLWWRRRLGERAEHGATRFVELKLAPSSAELELRLVGGRSLVLRPGVDLGWLREVASALEAQA